MPELPEVETIRRGLSKLLPGKVIANVWHDWQKSFPNAPADAARFMVGAKIEAVHRRAKVLIIDLSSEYSLVIHLKMTGQLVFVNKYQQNAERRMQNVAKKQLHSSFLIPHSSETKRFAGGHPTDSLINGLPDKSTRVIIEFYGDKEPRGLRLDTMQGKGEQQDDTAHGPRLFFNDQRKFGWMRLLPTVEVPEIDFMKKVGPEPLEDDFTVDKFINNILRRRQSTIKAILLDQTVLAGVGNIYADESLWAAKIHPAMPAGQIPRTKLIKLYSELRRILAMAIAEGGSTDRNYVDAKGKKGSYLKFAQVFRREGQPCPRCGTTIEKIRVAGRGTHICPKCQRSPK